MQDSQRKRLSSALGEDALCAAINNNNRAYAASIEFQEHMEEVLQPQLQVRAPSSLGHHAPDVTAALILS